MFRSHINRSTQSNKFLVEGKRWHRIYRSLPLDEQLKIYFIQQFHWEISFFSFPRFSSRSFFAFAREVAIEQFNLQSVHRTNTRRQSFSTRNEKIAQIFGSTLQFSGVSARLANSVYGWREDDAEDYRQQIYFGFFLSSVKWHLTRHTGPPYPFKTYWNGTNLVRWIGFRHLEQHSLHNHSLSQSSCYCLPFQILLDTTRPKRSLLMNCGDWIANINRFRRRATLEWLFR